MSERAQLTKVLAVGHRDPQRLRDKFMSALTDWILAQPGRSSVPIRELPPIARMGVVLNALQLSVAASGIGRFLQGREVGAEHAAAVDWCRAIGAHAAGDYLEAAVARLGGRVPADDEERDAAVMALEEQADIEGRLKCPNEYT
jgi:hypothetical protein